LGAQRQPDIDGATGSMPDSPLNRSPATADHRSNCRRQQRSARRRPWIFAV